MAIIKEKGTIAIMGEVQTGTSQSGNTWSRQQIIVDLEGYSGTYRKVALQASGQQVADLQSIIVGDKVEVSYQVTAREWQGKWFNNVDLYKVVRIEKEQPQKKTTPLVPPGSTEPVAEDLPF